MLRWQTFKKRNTYYHWQKLKYSSSRNVSAFLMLVGTGWFCLFQAMFFFPHWEMRKSISALVNKGIRCKLVDYPVNVNFTVLRFGKGSLSVCNNFCSCLCFRRVKIKLWSISTTPLPCPSATYSVTLQNSASHQLIDT